MDGERGNDVISISCKCLLLWPVSIGGGAFEKMGGEKRGGRIHWSYSQYVWLER